VKTGNGVKIASASFSIRTSFKDSGGMASIRQFSPSCRMKKKLFSPSKKEK